MAVNFGTDEESVEAEGRMPELSHPYCGEGFLNDVFKDEYGDNDKKVLVFQFVATDDEKFKGDDSDYNQLAHRNVEWEPRPRDLEAEDGETPSFQNTVNRIAYILKYFIGKEEAVNVTNFDAPDANTYWDKLRDRVIKALESTDYSDKNIRFKVLGSVYQGNARLQIPRYLGFISNEDSENPVSFSNDEKDQNREYEAAVSETPSGSDEFDDGDEELEF